MAATGSTDDCVQKNTVLEQLWDESSAAPPAEVLGAEVSKSLVKSGAGVVLPRSAEPRTGKESERGASRGEVSCVIRDGQWFACALGDFRRQSGRSRAWVGEAMVRTSVCVCPAQQLQGRRLALVQHLHRVRHRSGPAEVAQREFGRLENHCRSQGPCWVMGRPASVV